MKNALVFATALSVGSCVGISAAVATSPRVAPAFPLQKAPIVQNDARAKVLYDQTSNGSGVVYVSQKFDAAYSSYDSQIADDFTVPAGKTWTVSEVDVVGGYGAAGIKAKSENVSIYKPSAKGRPKLKVMEFDKVKGKDSAGSFSITLPQPVELKPGTYFVEVVISLDDAAGNAWGWEATAAGGPTFGYPATFKNPKNGYNTGCTTWIPLVKCVTYPDGQDMLFKILGTSK